MVDLLDIIFPKSCCICKRKGSYLCARCKKLFKRTLPECYICRRVSPQYKTHTLCQTEHENKTLNNVFVAWEYNSLSSILLKKYKYGYVKSISEPLAEFFIESIRKSSFKRNLKDTILTNVPLARNRLRERGFNQTTEISRIVAESFKIPFCEDLLVRRDHGHQALRDREERKEIREGAFILKEMQALENYKRITILDDVITTGATLEAISRAIRENLRRDIEINALCLFRGKPYYLEIL